MANKKDKQDKPVKLDKVFNYSDYRKYLGDFYRYQKEHRRRFSYQKFADQSGFNTKTFLFKVIAGDKQLSKRSIPHVAKAMGLKKREGLYFEALVNFNDAKTMAQRQHFYDRMRKYMRRGDTKILREHQFSYFSKWWTPVIRELVTSRPFGNDWVKLAKSVFPHIRPKQAKDSVKHMLALGLIKKTGRSSYERVNNVISTGPEVASFAIQNFHRDILRLASEAIDRYPRKSRQTSGAVLFVSKDTAEKMKQEIQELQKKFMDLASRDRKANRVYVAHFNLFPLSKIPKGER